MLYIDETLMVCRLQLHDLVRHVTLIVLGNRFVPLKGSTNLGR